LWSVVAAAHAQALDLDALRAAAAAADAPAAWERLIEAEIAAFGEEDIRVAASLTEYARLVGKADPVAARPFHERALAARTAAAGATHADNAINLSGIGAACVAVRDYPGALDAFGRALTIREHAHGPDHVDVAKSVENLARAHTAAHQYAAARDLWARAIGIRERVQGPTHLELGEAVGSYATSLWNLSELDVAEQQFERAITIISEVAGPDAPALARHLTNYGVLLSDRGAYAQARSVYQRALALDERSKGKNHPAIAATLNNLGNVARDQGDYAYARQCLERSLEIRRTALGPNHPDVARTLGNLAGLAAQLGHLDEARSLLEQAVDIRRAALGPDHPDVALNEVSLGAVLWRAGELRAARALYEHALAVREAVFGPDHPDVAVILNNLGSLLAEQGDLEPAREAFERALAIRERALGPDHPAVATSLANLASLAQRSGARAVVGPLRERALAIQEAAFGQDHPALVSPLTDLAAVRREDGDLVGARALVDRALGITERHLGPQHPDAATCWWHLGRLALLDHAPQAARDAFTRSVTIREGALGPDHAMVADALRGLAAADAALGDTGMAREHLDHARLIEQRRLTLLDGLSEREGLVYMHRARPVLDDWLAQLDEPDDAELTWAAWLVWRGAVTRRVRDRQAGAWSGGPAHASLDAIRQERVQNELTPRTPETADALDTRLRALVAEQEGIERALAESSEAWRNKQQIDRAGPEEVCAGIGDGARLVDVVRYQPTAEGAYYDAFVVDATCAVQRVRLGDASAIEGDLESWLQVLRDPSVATSRVDARGARVAETVWAPLGRLIPAGAPIWVVPDGALAALPWAALPVGGAYLVERYPVTVLPEAQALVAPPAVTPGVGALALGGLVYGDGPGPACATAPFQPLPGTADEVERLAAAWRRRSSDPVSVLSGAEASEELVRSSMSGRALLHFATHGTYAAGGCQGLSRASDDSITGLDPMLRSGLALSGANLGGAADRDGWLTAREWAGLDLRGTRWVVLSACETALGVITAGEGVQGLQRGVALSGAAQLVAALWTVPDASTATLMGAFYRHLLGPRSSGDASAALRAAQLDVLAASRDTGEARPQDWAAFTVSGVALREQAARRAAR
jgi:CHAT domain-containing protein/tetratricopeptide (TPR) repeat protein